MNDLFAFEKSWVLKIGKIAIASLNQYLMFNTYYLFNRDGNKRFNIRIDYSNLIGKYDGSIKDWAYMGCLRNANKPKLRTRLEMHLNECFAKEFQESESSK